MDAMSTSIQGNRQTLIETLVEQMLDHGVRKGTFQCMSRQYLKDMNTTAEEAGRAYDAVMARRRDLRILAGQLLFLYM